MYYNLEEENSHPIIKVELKEGAPKGKDLEAVRFLMQLGMQENCIKIPSNRSFEALKLLAATGNLFWKGKKLFVDPFTRLEFKEPFALESCDAIFRGDPIGMIRAGTLRWFSDDVEWNHFERPKELPPEPLPYLVLNDRTGAFADLFFDYGSFGKVAEHDINKAPYRNSKIEKNWEKDLLETDFVKKVVGTSHYYCPLEKVAKSLTFLLEIGWPIFDAKGCKVVRQSACHLTLENREETFLIKGKITYEHHEADLKDVMGAFNRRDKFIDLSAGIVGLLDPPPACHDFAEEEIIAEGIAVKKDRFGLLEEHFTKKELMGELSFTPPADAFRGILYPYQQEGVDWLSFLKKSSFSGLLADEMGLGKTVQTIAFFSSLSLTAPLLIIAPTSLLFNWRRELEKFLPAYPVYVHSGPERLQNREKLIEQRIILTSYALLRIDSALLESLAYECIVLDEAQMIKNPDSQIARSVFRLQAHMRLAITGTPIENSSQDLWSLFHFLMPDLLGERSDFQLRLKSAESDNRYMKNIRRQIRPFILRRTKEVIKEQLPEKIEQTLWVEMEEEQKLFYDAYLAKARSGLLKKVALDGSSRHRFEVLELILRLRQICCHPLLLGENIGSAKFERVLEDLEAALQEKRKVLVYSQFTEMLQLIGKALKDRGWNYAYLDGATKEREKVVQQFQENPDLPIFLISLKAGGVGLNLTAADYVFIFDPWWNAAVENQAMSRAHRLGRKETVIVKRYATVWSIEEKMMRLKESKEHLFDSLIDSITPSSLDDIVQHLFSVD